MVVLFDSVAKAITTAITKIPRAIPKYTMTSFFSLRVKFRPNYQLLKESFYELVQTFDKRADNID